MKMPRSIEKYQHEYKEGCWKNYSYIELAYWIHLFMKRSKHRSLKEKKEKDIQDASNYLDILISKFKEDKENTVGGI